MRCRSAVLARSIVFRLHRNQTRGGTRTAGFTLVEVMVAAIVLVLGITTAITTLQRGFQALDTARNLTFASQVMQSEFERLRLKSWAQLQALQDSGDNRVDVATVNGAAPNFQCRRSIRELKTDMKEITLLAEWNGYDGRPHTVSYMTRYGKSGLYDYFYTAQ
jgi:Tfp pilus assembly protein PilV